MTLECPICGKCNIERLSDGHNEFKLFQCKECLIDFFFPLIIPEDFYKKAYGDFKLLFGYKILGKVPWHQNQFLRNLNHSGQSLLDIGCGGGEFLNECNKKGYQTYGIDVNPLAVKRGSDEYGLKVSTKSLSELIDEKCKYDFITFFEVLEHLTDPMEFLNQVAHLLKPDGKIVLSVPSKDRTRFFNDSWDYPPHHFTRWDLRSLKSVLEKANYRIVLVKKEPFNVRYFTGHLFYKISDSYKTMHKLTRLAVAGIVGVLLYLPLKLTGGRGKYIYVVAQKNCASDNA